jgi:D-alanyl-lipoteichoic acid acyltransferase DltB (MBOAT superfamily)
MLFNSLEFAVFLPVVFYLYWSLNHRKQNAFLVLASYFFYGWWDWHFLGLIVLSSLADFFAGLAMGRTDNPRRRRWLLYASLSSNLGLLGFFKYYGFFVDSFVELLRQVGFHTNVPTLRIILPVGISFYTFQTLSYTIDVYRKRLEPTSDIVSFMAFVSFFPQLVAGPIERAQCLLAQFVSPREFDLERAKDGCRQMLWGLFKKVVIADGLAVHIESAYGNPVAGGTQLAYATVFFAAQIYCDFSGYSDIALGCARLLGFRLMRNFAYPYFATSIGDFWQRWHISLSSWFRDYVYIPLGGSRVSKFTRLRNLVITFTVSGLWHGANWTFVLWGFLHSLYYVPEVLLRGRVPEPQSPRLRSVFAAVKILVTFTAVVVAWVFFRAKSVSHAFVVLGQIFTIGTQQSCYRPPVLALVLIAGLACWEWRFRHRQHGFDVVDWPRPVRWTGYYLLLALIAGLGTFSDAPFIYFQF